MPLARRAARLLVRDKYGAFLLVHTTKEGRNRWEFPGGKIDEGERAMDAAIRECKEETDILADDCCFLCSRDIHIDGEDWTITYYTAHMWIGTAKLMEPTKADRVDWVGPSVIDALPQIPRLLVDVMRFSLRGLSWPV